MLALRRVLRRAFHQSVASNLGSVGLLQPAAALGGMKQDKADPILDILLEFGINHIDTAAAYGDSGLRIGPLSQLTRLSEPGYSTSLAIWFSLAGNVHT